MDSKYINVAENYNPDSKRSKNLNKVKSNDSVIIDDDSIISNNGSDDDISDVEVKQKSEKTFQSKQYDPETCVIESSVQSLFSPSNKQFSIQEGTQFINKECRNDHVSPIKESYHAQNPLLASNCDDRVTEKKKEDILLGSEMRNPLEESALDEVEHLESVNGSPIICKTSKTLFTAIVPAKFNNHASLCLHEDDIW